MKLKVLAFVLAAANLFASPCHAQYGASANFSVAHIGPNASEPWIIGPTFTFQTEFGRRVAAGLDLRVSVLRENGIGVNAYDAGPRFAFKRRNLPFKPYFEVLMGALEVRNRRDQDYVGHFDVQFLGGIDKRINRHLDYRAIEYSFGFTPDNTNRNTRNQLSTGLVARF